MRNLWLTVLGVLLVAGLLLVGCPKKRATVQPLGHSDRPSKVTYEVSWTPAGGGSSTTHELTILFMDSPQIAKISLDGEAAGELEVTDSGHLTGIRSLGDTLPLEAFFLLTALPKQPGQITVGQQWETDLTGLTAIKESSPDVQIAFSGKVQQTKDGRAVFEQIGRWKLADNKWAAENDASTAMPALASWSTFARGEWTWNEATGRLESALVRYTPPLLDRRDPADLPPDRVAQLALSARGGS